jgi:hypothetical protein
VICDRKRGEREFSEVVGYFGCDGEICLRSMFLVKKFLGVRSRYLRRFLFLALGLKCYINIDIFGFIVS